MLPEILVNRMLPLCDLAAVFVDDNRHKKLNVFAIQ